MTKFNVGDVVYENERYFEEGIRQFGKSLRRIHSLKIKSIIFQKEDSVVYELENGHLINEFFLSSTPFIN